PDERLHRPDRAARAGLQAVAFDPEHERAARARTGPAGSHHASAASIAPRSDSGAWLGAWRESTRPSRPTRNLLKFHLIASTPRNPPFCALSHFHSGCAPPPLTSTLANM